MDDVGRRQYYSIILVTYFLFVNTLRNVNGGITSTFVRSEFPATDIPLDHEVFAVPPGYNAPQQVHITQGDYDGKAVIISWITPDEPGSSEVQYGKSNKNYEFTALGTAPTKYTFYQYKSGYIHHCLLSNLEHYMESKAKAVLFLGDLSYADRYASSYEYDQIGLRWDTWGRFVEPSTAYQPWIWNTGNHEVDFLPQLGEMTTFKNYLNRYTTPYKACNSSDPLWYSIRRASAHIIVLSSYSPYVKYTPQYIWLKQELKNVDREKTPWLIVLMHIPFYNSNSAHFMEGEGMRSTFESWFVDYKVDVVFAGHVHAYERSNRISNIKFNVSNGYPYPVPDESAPLYITVGDGGNQEGLAGPFLDPQPEYSAFREMSYGHSTLEIFNRTHALYHWNRNDNGKKLPTDAFVLHNQYWASKQMRKEKKHYLRSVAAGLGVY
ncbi:hypothetical protein F8388_004413 [Cannabis sativa]|uniref:Purple acid phosphatase n=1 Tax=Cannabis sativa TaxID=3483 RepID=A0A7J6HA12_CANSA|nr:hypothetical protein F8388_004413 [Cannabis sativa]